MASLLLCSQLPREVRSASVSSVPTCFKMPSRSLRNKLIAGVAVVVVLAVSLGVGLGVGLKHDDISAASSTKAGTASSASAANTVSLEGELL